MTADPYTPHSGDLRFHVREYQLNLRYRVRTNRLDGEVTLLAVADANTTSIRLDLVGLHADRVRVDGEKRTTFRQGQRGLTITPAKPLKAGQQFRIEVRYAGSPGPRPSRWGQLGWEHLTDGILVASQPIGAPTWYPCNDRPADKALYRIEITLDAGYTVAATGALRSQEASSGRVTWTFADDLPTASYLVALHIGRYRIEPLELGDVPGSVYFPAPLRAQVRADLAPLGSMMRLFTDTFGPYPMQRYDVVVTEDDLEIPLESQGMAVFGANHLDGHGASERLVAHELAHQWFGNSVGLERWSDIWLNEGFCCYAEWLWSEASGKASCDQLADRFHASLARLPQDITVGDPGATLMFDDRVYKRGALTLHAVRQSVGDAAFFTAVRRWVAERRQATGTTADFIELASRSTGRHLAPLFDAWLFQRTLPELPARATPR